MELRVFTEPQQGATYDDLLRVAQEAERLGFGAFFRSDHYLAMGGDGQPGPSDAWVTLAGLARETSTIRLGTLMTSATFRHPGPLAITVAGVDQMSGGRVELGLGAGWYDAEHAAYGIPFPSTGERFDLLEEQLAVITGLWGSTGGFSHDGDALPGRGLTRAAEARAGPAADPDRRQGGEADTGAGRPVRRRVQPALRPVRGGPGAERPGPAGLRGDRARPRQPAVLERTGALRRRGRRRGSPPRGGDRPGRRQPCAATTSAARWTRWWTRSAATPSSGQTRLYLQTLDLQDLDHLRLVASEVMPQVSRGR